MLAPLRPVLALVVALASAPPAEAAAPDDDVEWSGVSHVAWQDRRPLCPVDGESFAVRFQTWRNDLTAANVLVTANAVTTPAAASVIATRGPYDVWQAQVPATAASTERYVIELIDGADTDYLGPAGVSDGPPVDGFALDFVTLSHAPVGATRTSDGGAVFRVWAPGRTSAYARGEFNGWGLATPLAKVGEHFIGRAAGVAHRHSYKLYFPELGAGGWKPDARPRALNPSEGPYNTYFEDPFVHAWGVQDFDTPAFEELVIYQLHVGTFSGRNDPAGTTPHPARYVDVAARAGHLAELGVNAVMLNPITEFPGDESAGYDPITAWAPEWKYGTPSQFKALVDSLHAHGIAVLLDIVWNHFSNTDNHLWYYDGTQRYFDVPQVETPWGSQADFDHAEVRDYFAHSALHWLEEYKVDGFRMDATDYMNRFPQEAAGWSLMQRFNDDLDRRWADKIAIAEQLPDDSWVTRPTSLGGAGFDSQYHDAFTDELRQEIFDAALGDPEMWKIAAIVQGGGEHLNGRFVTHYAQLHDEAWPTNGGQRMVKTIDTTFPHDDAYARGRMKLALGMVMATPGIPAMLMGDEWLEDTPFGTGSFERIDWSKKITYADHFAYVKRLIELRRTLDPLRADRPVSVLRVDEGGNVIVFQRNGGGGEPALVVANFGNTDFAAYRLGVPLAGDWTELVSSGALAYGGGGLDNPGTLSSEPVPTDGQGQSLVLRVPAMGFAIYRPGTPLDAGARPAPPARARITALAPVPARDGATVSFALPSAGEARVEVFDVAGRSVAVLAAERFAAGSHTVRWNGRDAAGRPVAAGLYFVRLASPRGADRARLPLTR